MVPYSFTMTSHIIVTLFLAMVVYIGINIVMIRQHGFHTMSFFYPAGCPLPMLPLLVLIEVVSHLMKVVSLSVRLFANMMSGHILLKVLLGFAWTMMMAGGWTSTSLTTNASSIPSIIPRNSSCINSSLCFRNIDLYLSKRITAPTLIIKC